MNKKMKKTIASICMGAAMLTLTPAVSWAEASIIPVNDEQESAIAPYMMYIEDAQCKLTIKGTSATVECYVAGNANNATKAKVIAELQLKSGNNWIPVKIWTMTENAYRASVDENYTITIGNTYRVKATMTVWEGSLSETKTFYSE